jgi:hypothetical protein
MHLQRLPPRRSAVLLVVIALFTAIPLVAADDAAQRGGRAVAPAARREHSVPFTAGETLAYDVCRGRRS